MDARRVGMFAACVGVVLLAGGLRCYHLGDRPFHDDELATFDEVDALVHKPAPSTLTVTERLPRAIPIGYLVQWLDYQCFGRTEWGSRVLNALLGTASVLLVVVGISLTGAGRGMALVTGVLIALWPQHLYYSQENRFYMPAFVCASLCMLAGAIALHKRSWVWMVTASGLGVLAVFAHTTLLILSAGLLGAMLLAAWTNRDVRLGRLALVPAVALMLGCCVYLFYARPLLSGWNADSGWGLGPIKSLGAAIFKLGWPLCLLAGLGAVLALSRQREQDWYWLTWGVLWLASCLILPLAITHRSAYTFPPTLGVLVLAGQGIAHLAQRLAETSRPAAVAWVACACLLNLPGLISHCIDGSCPDYRPVADYIRAHWQPGDRLMATSPDLLERYLANGTLSGPLEPHKLEEGLQMLAQGTRGSGRVWIAVNYGRLSRPAHLLDWLGKHCSRELEVAPTRYDAFEYPAVLYLFHGETGSSATPSFVAEQ